MRLASNRPSGLMASTERLHDDRRRSGWTLSSSLRYSRRSRSLASMVSVELGVTVALIELTFGVVAGQRLRPAESGLARPSSRRSRRSFSRSWPGMEVDPAYMRRRLTASVGIGVVSFIGPFVVASAVAYLAARLERTRLADRRHRALDDLAGGRLRRARRARADGHEHRQAADERDVRHRPVHGDRALGDLHQAERLVPGVPRRLARADRRSAADRALVLRPLRRPGDRARDQARVRLPAPPDGARRASPTGTPSCRRSCSASS